MQLSVFVMKYMNHGIFLKSLRCFNILNVNAACRVYFYRESCLMRATI